MIEMCSEYWYIVSILSGVLSIISLVLASVSMLPSSGTYSELWLFPLGLILFGFTLYADTMEQTTEENFIAGYEEAFSEYDYTKLEACVDYRKAFSSGECYKYKNESKYRYCLGYICGYRDKSEQTKVHSLEINLSITP